MTKPTCWICKKEIDTMVFNYSIGQDMINKGRIIPGTFYFHDQCEEDRQK